MVTPAIAGIEKANTSNAKQNFFITKPSFQFVFSSQSHTLCILVSKLFLSIMTFSFVNSSGSVLPDKKSCRLTGKTG